MEQADCTSIIYGYCFVTIFQKATACMIPNFNLYDNVPTMINISMGESYNVNYFTWSHI